MLTSEARWEPPLVAFLSQRSRLLAGAVQLWACLYRPSSSPRFVARRTVLERVADRPRGNGHVVCIPSETGMGDRARRLTQDIT